MVKNDWREALKNFFEDLSILEESKKETVQNFHQFCEFIAEPAFETLNQEFKQYGIKSQFQRSKGKAISFKINFSKSKVDNFTYIIRLPENSFKLKLKLVVRGRRSKKSQIEEREMPFMENVDPDDILKLSQEELIKDVIEKYKNFNYDALV
ncbi:MAG: hypothetical protein JSV96_13755 [Candidatus Aminicenantes bacterium]|nr:MAG: hypothetical protein JSV96_13755 [Candidatus Aminicenantes bacterium]